MMMAAVAMMAAVTGPDPIFALSEQHMPPGDPGRFLLGQTKHLRMGSISLD